LQDQLVAHGESSAAEIAAAFSKRQISFTYRDVEMKFLVRDTREEVELKVCAALKERRSKVTHPQQHHKPSQTNTHHININRQSCILFSNIQTSSCNGAFDLELCKSRNQGVAWDTYHILRYSCKHYLSQHLPHLFFK